MASLPKFYLIVLILFTSMGFDQVSKNIAKSSLENSPPMSYLGETFRLQYAENTGSFLSLGSGLSKTTRFLLFTFLSGGLLIALFFYTIKSRDLQRKHIIALSLILGGGASNMIDRIVNDGKVIDFMNMGIGSLRTGIFNMADVLIMVGIAFILLFNFQSHKEKRSPSEDTESTQSKSAS